MATLARLQAWFSSQCDGDWEHDNGLTIDSLDNPGWMISLKTTGTKFSGLRVEPSRDDKGEADWVHAHVRDGFFKVACSPNNLERALVLFLEAVESVPSSTPGA